MASNVGVDGSDSEELKLELPSELVGKIRRCADREGVSFENYLKGCRLKINIEKKVPSQERVKTEQNLSYAEDLAYGELGEIIQHEKANGVVITKTLQGFMAIHSKSKEFPAFKAVWPIAANMVIRKLPPDETIIISNGNL